MIDKSCNEFLDEPGVSDAWLSKNWGAGNFFMYGSNVCKIQSARYMGLHAGKMHAHVHFVSGDRGGLIIESSIFSNVPVPATESQWNAQVNG